MLDISTLTFILNYPEVDRVCFFLKNIDDFVRIVCAKMSLPILAIFCTSFCISCQIQQLQHLSIAAAPFPNQDWGTIPAEHDKEENQRPQLRWDSLLAPAHKQ